MKEGIIMKKFLLVLFVVLFSAGSAFAQGTTVDFGLGLASEPTGGFGTTIGGVAGVSFDFNTFINSEFKPHSDRIRFRGDISYFKWDDKVSGVEIKYRRIPVFLGGRYVYPVSPVISVFGEAGVEVSFDKVEVAVCNAAGDCERESDDDIHSGPAIGGGIIFNISDQFRIALNGRQHAVTDDYQTFSALFGISF
jgi:opacity protein-like surface antigen